MVVIKENVEFQYVLKNGKWNSSDVLTAYVLKKEQDFNRVGVAVGKKAGKSVIRNRLKRLIREAYRINEKDFILGYDIVFIWRNTTKVEEIDFHIVEKNLIKCLNKAGLMK